MRAQEFVLEGKMKKNHRDSSPGMNRYPGADSPYWKYRLGVASAGAPDNEHNYDVEGPVGQDMVTSHYSQAEEEIMNSAHKRVGFKPTSVAKKGSKETNVNTVSPVSNWNKK
jgi:hypothetical protein